MINYNIISFKFQFTKGLLYSNLLQNLGKSELEMHTYININDCNEDFQIKPFNKN